MEKKRYWLKLDKDFLKSSQIKVIKNMQNGKDYIFFYLSLLLESTETIGHLRFSESVPYTPEMLASVTDVNVDIVRSAMKLFSELGLLEVLEDGTIFMTEAPKMTGKESESAERVREYRMRKNNIKALQCNTDVTECNSNEITCNNDVTKCNDNKEKQRITNKEERTENKEQSINNKEEIIRITTITEYIEQNFGRSISPLEYEKIKQFISMFSDGRSSSEKDDAIEIIKYAVEISILNNKRTFSYIAGILNNWKACHYKNLEDIKDHDIKSEHIKADEEIFTYDWLRETQDE